MRARASLYRDYALLTPVERAAVDAELAAADPFPPANELRAEERAADDAIRAEIAAELARSDADLRARGIDPETGEPLGAGT